MRLVRVARLEQLEPGAEVVCIEDGMLHTRVVHDVDKKHATFLHGERIPLAKDDLSVLVVVDADGELVDVDVEDPRERPDLAKAAAALERCERAGLPESHPDYWSLYHGDRDTVAQYEDQAAE